MVKTSVAFEHLGEVFRKGQQVDDDHPLVTLAPHLFVLPDPPTLTPDPVVRVRGPLVNPAKKD
jgi:hypothetical protein